MAPITAACHGPLSISYIWPLQSNAVCIGKIDRNMGFPHHFLDVASKLKRVLVLYTHGLNDVNRVTK